MTSDTDSQQLNGEQAQNNHEEDVVTPWDVVARNSKGVDYDKLIRKF